MAGTLAHSPAHILQRLIIDLGLGSLPPSLAWPVYIGSEPDGTNIPDNVITVYNTDWRDHGRTMTDGHRQGMEGFQVRVRSQTQPVGYNKAHAIAIALDEQVYQRIVTIDGVSYLVHAISRSGGVLDLGKMQGSSRNLHTLNGFVSLTQY